MIELASKPALDIQESYGQLVSLGLPCPDLDPLEFLAQAQEQPRFYWQHGELTLVGMGKAVELSAWGETRIEDIRAQVQAVFHRAIITADHPLARPRLFGGFAFLPDFMPDHIWSSYCPAQFILPHYQLLRLGQQQWLTLNIQVGQEEVTSAFLAELEAALRQKMDELSHQAPLPKQDFAVLKRKDLMPYAEWQRHIHQISGLIAADDLQKLVLARACEIQTTGHIHLPRVLAALGQSYPECYRFLFEPRPQVAFLGATPELLIRVQANQLETMGLAGSIRRGATPAEDESLAQELLTSTKDQHEHQLVVESIASGLHDFASALEIGQTGVMRLKNIQHLHTPIRGHLQPTHDILSLLGVLHPTPAMGGKPRSVALQWISQLETLPRGWYAAPIGWLDSDWNGEFGVAIRSAVVQEQRAWVYAGAGIVAGSEAQKEWDETALKLRPMLTMLGGNL